MPPCALGLLPGQDSDQLVTHSLTVVSLGLVKLGHVVHVAGAESLPQLHHSLGGQSNEVVGKVLALVIVQFIGEDLAGLHLLNQSAVLIDVEASGLVDLTLVKNHLDRNLTLVVLHEVVEGHSSLETDEAGGKVDPEERTLGGSDAAVADPRTPGLEAPPLAWPVLLLYPQYMQSDFVEACSEHTMIAELLAMVFPEEGGAERAAVALCAGARAERRLPEVDAAHAVVEHRAEVEEANLPPAEPERVQQVVLHLGKVCIILLC